MIQASKTKKSKFSSNHSSCESSKGKKVKRQDSIHSEKRREMKNARKASYFTKAQKHQEGILSDADSLTSQEMKSLEQDFTGSSDESLTNNETFFIDEDMIFDTNSDLPIKKPSSAYVIFGKMKREQIMQQNPGIKVTDVVKQIAKQWQEQTKDQKLRYKELAKKDKDRYLDDLKNLTNGSRTVEKPKKPLTPYMLFVRETRPKVVSQNPNIPSLDIMKEVGRIWQNISEEELEYFKGKSKVDADRFKNEYSRFIQDINDVRTKNNHERRNYDSDNILSDKLHQKLNLKEIQLKEVRTLQKRQRIDGLNINTNQQQDFPQQLQTQTAEVSQQNIAEPLSPYMKAKREVARPKKPLSAYIFFSQDFREQIKEKHPQWSSIEIMKHVSQKWAQMDKTEKEPFNEKANKDKLRYDNELLEFQQSTSENQKQQIFDLQRMPKIENQDQQYLKFTISNKNCYMNNEFSDQNDNMLIKEPATEDTSYNQVSYEDQYQIHDQQQQYPQLCSFQEPASNKFNDNIMLQESIDQNVLANQSWLQNHSYTKEHLYSSVLVNNDYDFDSHFRKPFEEDQEMAFTDNNLDKSLSKVCLNTPFDCPLQQQFGGQYQDMNKEQQQEYAMIDENMENFSSVNRSISTDRFFFR